LLLLLLVVVVVVGEARDEAQARSLDQQVEAKTLLAQVAALERRQEEAKTRELSLLEQVAALEAKTRELSLHAQVAALEASRQQRQQQQQQQQEQQRRSSIEDEALRALTTDADIKTEAIRRLARRFLFAAPDEAKALLRHNTDEKATDDDVPDVAELSELDRMAVPLIHKYAQHVATLAFGRWAANARLLAQAIRAMRRDAAYMCWACRETLRSGSGSSGGDPNFRVRILNCGHYCCTTCLLRVKAMPNGGKCGLCRSRITSDSVLIALAADD
jgi:hypothetical protein